MDLTPLSELDAVNEILSTIGESPVNSLADNTSVDVVNAYRLLNKVSRQVQTRGWTWNTTQERFQPDMFTKEIAYSASILRVSSQDGMAYSKRGNKLYNATARTTRFNNLVELEVIRQLVFDDLPEEARSYITAVAARQFSSRYLGDPTLAMEVTEDERNAWRELNALELTLGGFNMLENPELIQWGKR